MKRPYEFQVFDAQSGEWLYQTDYEPLPYNANSDKSHIEIFVLQDTRFRSKTRLYLYLIKKGHVAPPKPEPFTIRVYDKNILITSDTVLAARKMHGGIKSFAGYNDEYLTFAQTCVHIQTGVLVPILPFA